MLKLKIAAALALAAAMTTGWAADAPAKNWTPPAYRIYGQKLADDTMKAHPELLSITLHGVPPGQDNVYTMFAGSYHDRVGNPDDPDDIDVSKKGITIVDPRWHRPNDNPKKFVILMPMRDRAGQNIGLVVYAFKHPPKNPHRSAVELDYLRKSTELRDALQKKISSYEDLFKAAK